MATEQETPNQPSRLVWLWVALILAGAAALGVVVGIRIGTREPSSTLDAAGRPTVLIAQPSASASPVSSPIARGSPSADEEYVVQAGDTLRSIALQRYGDSEQWQRIYQANRDAIGPNPDTVPVGMRLKIPPT